MGRTTEIQGMLEIDHDRGVIYFHAGKKDFIMQNNVVTVLRICSLPKPIPQVRDHGCLDITHMKCADWGKDKVDG